MPSAPSARKFVYRTLLHRWLSVGAGNAPQLAIKQRMAPPLLGREQDLGGMRSADAQKALRPVALAAHVQQKGRGAEMGLIVDEANGR